MENVMIILKVNAETGVIEDIGETWSEIPEGYEKYETESYPPDVMSGYYRLIDGEIVKDDELYESWLENQTEKDEEGSEEEEDFSSGDEEEEQELPDYAELEESARIRLERLLMKEMLEERIDEMCEITGHTALTVDEEAEKARLIEAIQEYHERNG